MSLQGRSSYNFFTASAECRRLGGTVTSIGSMAEMTYVNGKFTISSYHFSIFQIVEQIQQTIFLGLVGAAAYWIGYHRTGFSSNWEDGSPVVFTNYRRGQPDGCCGGAGCTLVNYRGNMGEWDDAGCHIIWRIPTYVVCKRPLS
uniref:C-type lectin domain-containing protein n=1 Tax=Dracunculus medinensis TaxID=318479 RepID=A0A0N4UKB3_DRAME